MARTHSARAIALTIGVPHKWIDNLLSHFELPGIARSRQGMERQITDEGLLAIEVTRILNFELGIPLAHAKSIATSAMHSRDAAGARVATDSGVSLTLPLPAIERRLRERMLDAVDAVAHVRRGRPRGK